MLEEMLRWINNRFDCGADGTPYGSVEGTFAIEDGGLTVDGLKDGQYFWVEGSVLNDGLHRYPAEDMADEEFEGRVVFLRVPRAVAAIAEEAEAWCEANADAVAGPYQSESFGGYSYTKATGSTNGNEAPAAAWQLQFGSRLRQWRKISRDWA